MDLKKIIEESGLKTDFIAAKLFPDNAHPKEALWRLIRLGVGMKAEQVKALAEVLNVSADELLGLKWSGKIGPSGIILRNGPVTVAVLNHGAWELWIDGIMHTYALDWSMSIRDFLHVVESEIESLT